MDVTIEVMLPPRGETDWTKQARADYPNLSVVAVYHPRKNPAAVGMPRTGYIHVTDLPIEDFFAVERLGSQIWDDEDGKIVAQRQWACQWQRMPLKARTELLQGRQTIIPWETFRGYLRNLKEERDLTEQDLGGRTAIR